MDYAEGGSLQDVLESSPLDGRVSESDLRWWCPQIVSALNWCHQQGFAHRHVLQVLRYVDAHHFRRDIKPNNFVLTSTRHIQLIDFGSAAPLLPPDVNGRRQLPKEFCFVPCGTCDYISPEILLAHERALVRMEMEADEEESSTSRPRLLDEDDDASGEEGYGAETDWWSVGSMLYEMAYGITPFFAESVQTTYFRIMDHEVCCVTMLLSSASDFFYRPISSSIACHLYRAASSACLRGEAGYWSSRTNANTLLVVC
jgi:serine/threonine protein kinase